MRTITVSMSICGSVEMSIRGSVAMRIRGSVGMGICGSVAMLSVLLLMPIANCTGIGVGNFCRSATLANVSLKY
jgi:hypothetical protein